MQLGLGVDDIVLRTVLFWESLVRRMRERLWTINRGDSLSVCRCLVVCTPLTLVGALSSAWVRSWRVFRQNALSCCSLTVEQRWNRRAVLRSLATVGWPLLYGRNGQLNRRALFTVSRYRDRSQRTCDSLGQLNDHAGRLPAQDSGPQGKKKRTPRQARC